MKTTIEYKVLRAKLRNAKTVGEIAKIEAQADRVYNAGLMTSRELFRLCEYAMGTIGAIECGELEL